MWGDVISRVIFCKRSFLYTVLSSPHLLRCPCPQHTQSDSWVCLSVAPRGPPSAGSCPQSCLPTPQGEESSNTSRARVGGHFCVLLCEAAPSSRAASRPGMEPTTFLCRGRRCNPLSHLAEAIVFVNTCSPNKQWQSQKCPPCLRAERPWYPVPPSDGFGLRGWLRGQISWVPGSREEPV